MLYAEPGSQAAKAIQAQKDAERRARRDGFLAIDGTAWDTAEEAEARTAALRAQNKADLERAERGAAASPAELDRVETRQADRAEAIRLLRLALGQLAEAEDDEPAYVAAFLDLEEDDVDQEATELYRRTLARAGALVDGLE